MTTKSSILVIYLSVLLLNSGCVIVKRNKFTIEENSSNENIIKVDGYYYFEEELPATDSYPKLFTIKTVFINEKGELYFSGWSTTRSFHETHIEYQESLRTGDYFSHKHVAHCGYYKINNDSLFVEVVDWTHTGLVGGVIDVRSYSGKILNDSSFVLNGKVYSFQEFEYDFSALKCKN